MVTVTLICLVAVEHREQFPILVFTYKCTECVTFHGLRTNSISIMCRFGGWRMHSISFAFHADMLTFQRRSVSVDRICMFVCELESRTQWIFASLFAAAALGNFDMHGCQ